MKQYRIKDGYWTGEINYSDKPLKHHIRKTIPDESKHWAWAGKNWAEFPSLPSVIAARQLAKDKADYANLDKIVKQKQIELGMDLSKEGLVQNGILFHKISQTPVPEKTQAAFDWLNNLWQTKYFSVSEGDSVTFDDIDPLEISYAEIATELGF